jgi:tetratricopeptide (TPR) repeat protein
MVIIRIGLAIVIFSVVMVHSGMAQNPPLKDPHFARGLELQQAGKLQEAIKEYELSIQETPRFPVLANLGVIYSQLGRYAEAVNYYQRALKLAPGQPRLVLNLGLAHYKMGDNHSAIPQFQQVLKAEPGNLQARTLLADCFYQLGQYQQVISELKDIPGQYPDNLTIAYLLGNAYVLEGQMEEGQKMLDRILSKGNSAEAHLMMGTIYSAMFKSEEALAELRESIRLNPQLPLAHSSLGTQLLRSNVFDMSEAIGEFEAELKINPNDFNANFYTGYLYRRNKEYDKALISLKKAVQLRPNDGGALLQISVAHYLKGELEEAQQILEGVVKRDPDYLDAHVNLARVYYRKKMVVEGEREQRIADEMRTKLQEMEKSGKKPAVPVRLPDSEKRIMGTP